MHVAFVHPPDPAPTVPLAPGAPKDAPSPSWLLLSLLTFLHAHTGHQARLLDTRLYARFEDEFPAALARVPAPRILVVLASPARLGEVVAVVETARRAAPDAPIALCGSFPSSFPRQALALPQVDFALAGDPEPILRALLDFLHAPNRLRQTPGLIRRDTAAASAAWLPDLAALTVPGWEGPDWPAYAAAPGEGASARLRISRGHPGGAPGRACGGAGHPLRFWPLDRLAAALGRCAHKGIVELAVDDPPGLWTPDRLRAWCAALHRAHHTHPWSIRLFPRLLSTTELEQLAAAHCAAVEFLLPSCEPDLLARYECRMDPSRLARVTGDLHAAGIEPRLHFWVGGPEETGAEADRIRRWIDRAGHVPFTLEPFPLRFDSPLYAERAATAREAGLDAWLVWARDPWLLPRPVMAWGGAAGATAALRLMNRLYEHGDRSAARRLRRLRAWWNDHSLIGEIEERLAGLFRRASRP